MSIFHFFQRKDGTSKNESQTREENEGKSSNARG